MLVGGKMALLASLFQAMLTPHERMAVKNVLHMHSALQSEVRRLLDLRAAKGGATSSTSDQIEHDLQVHVIACFEGAHLVPGSAAPSGTWCSNDPGNHDCR